MQSKWPKIYPKLTLEQQYINDDFMRYWHEVLASSKKFNAIEDFNHGYPCKHSQSFISTLEIGAGLGEHLVFEKLTAIQKQHYVALELRENMAEKISQRFPDIQVCVADCQNTLPYPNQHFNRIIAIHVLEHLPNLPAAIRELHRVSHPESHFFVVIPCEGGLMYSLARRLSAKRLFEKRYNQSYEWFIKREHVNNSHEIIEELTRCFRIIQKEYFPFRIPSVNTNLCIGLTLQPIT